MWDNFEVTAEIVGAIFFFKISIISSRIEVRTLIMR